MTKLPDTYCFLVTPAEGTPNDEMLRLAQLLRDFSEHVINNGLRQSHFESDAGDVQQLA